MLLHASIRLKRFDGKFYNDSVGQSRGVTFQTLRLHQWNRRLLEWRPVEAKPITYWKSSVSLDVYSIGWLGELWSNLLSIRSSNHRTEMDLATERRTLQSILFYFTHWNDMCVQRILKDIELGELEPPVLYWQSERKRINCNRAVATKKAHAFSRLTSAERYGNRQFMAEQHLNMWHKILSYWCVHPISLEIVIVNEFIVRRINITMQTIMRCACTIQSSNTKKRELPSNRFASFWISFISLAFLVFVELLTHLIELWLSHTKRSHTNANNAKEKQMIIRWMRDKQHI